MKRSGIAIKSTALATPLQTQKLYRVLRPIAAGVALISLFALLNARIGAGTANNARAARARLSDAVSIQSAGRGKPWINITHGRDLFTAYEGSDGVTEVMKRDQG